MCKMHLFPTTEMGGKGQRGQGALCRRDEGIQGVGRQERRWCHAGQEAQEGEQQSVEEDDANHNGRRQLQEQGVHLGRWIEWRFGQRGQEKEEAIGTVGLVLEITLFYDTNNTIRVHFRLNPQRNHPSMRPMTTKTKRMMKMRIRTIPQTAIVIRRSVVIQCYCLYM